MNSVIIISNKEVNRYLLCAKGVSYESRPVHTEKNHESEVLSNIFFNEFEKVCPKMS